MLKTKKVVCYDGVDESSLKFLLHVVNLLFEVVNIYWICLDTLILNVEN